jgi:hypothetical protein
VIAAPQLTAGELAEIWANDARGRYVRVTDGHAAVVTHGVASNEIWEPADVGASSYDATVFEAIRDWMRVNRAYLNVWCVERDHRALYDERGNCLGELA